jgi:hypothetical protein
LIGDQVAPVRHEQRQLGSHFLVRHQLFESSPHPRLIGDDVGVPLIGLGFTGVGVSGTIHGHARNGNHPLASLPKKGERQGGDSSRNIDRPNPLLSELDPLIDRLSDVLLGVLNPARQQRLASIVYYSEPVELFACIMPA